MAVQDEMFSGMLAQLEGELGKLGFSRLETEE